MTTLALVAITMMALIAAIAAARARTWATAHARRRDIARRRAALVEAHLELARERRANVGDRADRFTRGGRPAGVR